MSELFTEDDYAAVQQPLVSVVLPTHGRKELLGRAVGSVLRQTFTDWELIVVDDNEPGSPDRISTVRIVRSLQSSKPVQLVCHDRNRGGAAARNSGSRKAAGRYIAFIDDDDEWCETKLERQVAFMEKAPSDVALNTCGYRKIYADSGIAETRIPDERTLTVKDLLRRNQVGTTSAVLCRREAFIAVGMFDETLPSKQDIDLYIRLARSYRLSCLPEVLLSWHRHAGESIGKDVRGVIRAHEIFHEKYRSEIAADSQLHAYRLRSLARLHVRNDDYPKARKILRRALRLNPRVSVLLEFLTANAAAAGIRAAGTVVAKRIRATGL